MIRYQVFVAGYLVNDNVPSLARAKELKQGYENAGAVDVAVWEITEYPAGSISRVLQ